MRSAKRIILANDSRLLREMLHRALNKTDHLEVLREVSDPKDLTSAIERFHPEWVIASFPPYTARWVTACMKKYPSVRFVLLLAPHQNRIKIKWQTSNEEEHSDVSLRELIQILEQDIQRS